MFIIKISKPHLSQIDKLMCENSNIHYKCNINDIISIQNVWTEALVTNFYDSLTCSLEIKKLKERKEKEKITLTKRLTKA